MNPTDPGTRRATFRFYGPLNDFLPHDLRQRDIPHDFLGTPAVKDRIERLGVPHTEVAALFIDGQPAALHYLLRGGERVAVYPPTYHIPLPSLLPPPAGEARFVVDVNLGRLARLLRLMGFDTLYRNDWDDAEIAALSAREDRILLTRDRRLLMRSIVRHGYYVRSDQPLQQLREVLDRYHLQPRARPFARCSKCNGLVRAVDKAAVAPLLEPRTRRYYQHFWQCQQCGQVYWEGTHMPGLEALLEEAARP